MHSLDIDSIVKYPTRYRLNVQLNEVKYIEELALNNNQEVNNSNSN
jgi:hypothetical protein